MGFEVVKREHYGRFKCEKCLRRKSTAIVSLFTTMNKLILVTLYGQQLILTLYLAMCADKSFR